MTRTNKLDALIHGVILGVLATLASPLALAQTAFKVDVPSQDLADALRAIGRQTSTNIIFEPAIVKGIKVAQLRADLTADQAVDQLLDGTKLTAQRTSNDTIVIQREKKLTEPPIASQPSTQNSAHALSDRIRVAQAEPSSSSSEEQSTQDARGNAEIQQIDEIVVTGTYIRGTPLASPKATYTRQDLERGGHATIQDFFKDLPQSAADIGPEGIFGATSSLANENTQRASGISLRGLGPQSTLVLLNGQRRPGNVNGRVFDVSEIPLAALERADVVTGAASAIYGTDAVAGVVNLITRRDFEGAETQVFGGIGEHGGDQYNINQTFGIKSDRGGFVASADYFRQSRLDATHAGRVSAAPSPFALTPMPDRFDLIPDSSRVAGFMSGHLQLSDRIELYGDALYSNLKNTPENSFFISGSIPNARRDFNESRQYSAALGLRTQLGPDWNLDVSGLYGQVLNHGPSYINDVLFGADDRATLVSGRAVVNGTLLAASIADLKVALGTEYRRESYSLSLLSGGTTTEPGETRVRSAFGEISIPIRLDGGIGDYQLDLSAAARYDDYSQFGHTINPQFGTVLRLPAGLNVRAAYGEAFRAPDLLTLGNEQIARIRVVPDPGAPGNRSPLLLLTGGNPDLQPEVAQTWTAGLDFTPASSPGLKASLTYFDISYRERIDTPGVALSAAFTSQGVLGPLLNRNPSEEAIRAAVAGASTFINQSGTPFDPASQSYLTTFPRIAIYDSRRNNIGIEKVSGVDASVHAEFDVSEGQLWVESSGTYYLDYTRRITPTSPELDQLNQPGRLPDFRIRSSLGFTQARWEFAAHVNYTDGYDDPLTGPTVTVASWTTVDVDVGWSSEIGSAWTDGLSATLSIQNVTGKEPPLLLSDSDGLNYDAVNATALGRFVALRLRKNFH